MPSAPLSYSMMLIWVYHGSYIPRFITDDMKYIIAPRYLVCVHD